jgi:glycosyltransferase 2 family protein
MNATKKSAHRFNPIVLVLLLGLVAFVIYVYFFINPSQVIGILSKTNLSIYAGAFVAYFMFALFSSFVWNRLLNSLSVKISKRKTLLFTWVGLFFEATVPQLGWSGEVSKTYLLAKDSKIDAGKIGASVVGQKIFTMTITIVALSTGLGLVLLNYDLPPTAIIIISTVLVLSILSLAIIYYVSFKATATKTLLSWAVKIISFFRKRWDPQNFNGRAEEMLSKFHEGIVQLRGKPKALVVPIVCAIVGFVFEISVVFLTFLALGYPVPIDRVLIVFTLAGTLQTVGVTIFGFTEIVMTTAFTALGIQVDVSFAVTLLTRVVNLWFRLIISYLALQWAGIKILNQTRKSQQGNILMQTTTN